MLNCNKLIALEAIIQKEIDLIRRLDILKSGLGCRYDYSPLAAFRSVDKYNDGKIEIREVEK